MSEYCTIEELQARLWPEDVTASDEDLLVLQQVIEAVSRWIEVYTGRRFYAATESRYYTADDNYEQEVDDVLSVSELVCDEDGDRTYEITWTADDYDLLPENAALDSKPYTLIAVSPDGDYTFPVGIRKGVKVTGSFGFSATGEHPAAVREGCLLMCERMYKRSDAPLGVTGSPELGMMELSTSMDPDVRRMLAGFVMWD